MAYFDRFDICEAYAVLEWDWNMGGWLHPSVVRLDHGGVMTYMFFWLVIELALTIGAVQLILKKGGF
jgi:hypothetical protein